MQMKEFGEKLNARLNSLDPKTRLKAMEDATFEAAGPYDDTQEMTGEASKGPGLAKAQSVAKLGNHRPNFNYENRSVTTGLMGRKK